MRILTTRSLILAAVLLGSTFSPARAQSTISGAITYPGHEQNYPNGEIHIGLWQDVGQWPFPPVAPIYDFTIGPPVDFNNPVPYTIDDPVLVAGHDYFVGAMFDEDNTITPIEPEAEGWYGDDVGSGRIDIDAGSVGAIDIELKEAFYPGGGFSFDFGATGGYAEVDFYDLDGGPEFTVEMFIKLHSPFGTGGPYEFFHRGEWGFLDYVGDNGAFRFSLGGIDEINWQFSPNPGEWHHIAADYDGTNMTIYWDGDPKVSVVTGGGNLTGNSNPVRFGERFDGLVDIIRISGTALYKGNNFDPWSQPYNPTSLLYNCNEGSGNQLIDDGENEHHATITGTPTWDPDEPLGPMGPGLWTTDVWPDYVDLEWDRWPDPDNEFVKYELRRRQGTAPADLGSAVVLTETDVNVTSWRDEDVVEGQEYHYKLWMYDQTNWRYETMDMTVIPSASIGFDVIVPRSANGQVHHALWSPGQDWQVDQPDFKMGPIYEDFGSAGESRYYWMPGIPTGDGYTLISMLDQDGSSQSGPNNCDQDEDLIGGMFNLSIWEGSEYVEIYLSECDEFGARPQIGLSTSRLDFTRDVYDLTFTVGNDGQDTLFWEVYIEYDSSGTLDWITSLAPVEGYSTSPGEDEITVTIEPTGTAEYAEIYVDGYADEDYDEWIGDRFIDVYLDAWAPPPDISGSFQGSTVNANQNMTVQLELTALTGIKGADLVYLRGGDQSTKNATFSNVGGDTYEATIPAGDVTDRGLVGFARVQDNLNQTVFSDTMEIRVLFNSVGIQTTPQKGYTMLSVPGELDDKNQLSVFEELGTYDKTKWRLFRWNGTDYSEFEGSATFPPGVAYWIITLDPAALAAGSGKSTQLKPPFSISLNQGWNQVGTPYNFDVDISRVTYPPGSIEPSLWEWDGATYRSVNKMMPGQGYWIYAYEATSVRIKPFAGGRLARVTAENPPMEWEGRIEASAGNVKDIENMFGVSSSASKTWDEYDRHEPPVIGDYITLAFDNRDWRARGGLYSRDIRGSSTDGHTWPFVVRTNQEGYVHLDFEWTQTLPSGWEVYIVYKDLGVVSHLREKPGYTFASDGTETPRNFVLVVGQSSFVGNAMALYNVIPRAFALDQNTPNPFNAVTTIRFRLPEESQVSLIIYDLLGHEVTALASRAWYNPGIHAVLWDGKDRSGREVSTGLYFYHITVTKNGETRFSSARKLILLK